MLGIGQPVHLDGVARLALDGELDVAGAATLEDRLVELGVSSTRLVVDLRGLRFIDSTGLAALVSAHARLVEGGSSLMLTVGPGQVRDLLELTALDQLFDIETTGAARAEDGDPPG